MLGVGARRRKKRADGGLSEWILANDDPRAHQNTGTMAKERRRITELKHKRNAGHEQEAGHEEKSWRPVKEVQGLAKRRVAKHSQARQY